MSYSSHSFIGRLTRDPESRTVKTGSEDARVVTFTVACDRPGAKGVADFYNVVTWRKLAETCEQYLGKGRLVHVAGRPQLRSWKATKDGVEYQRDITEIIATDVQFLDRADSNSANVPTPPADVPIEIQDDDLPF